MNRAYAIAETHQQIDTGKQPRSSPSEGDEMVATRRKDSAMNSAKCPQCNQVNEPGEQCGKCMWVAKTTPLHFQLQASAAGTVHLKTGPKYYAYERVERVPDWVHIRYVPLDQWDVDPTPPIPLKSSKRGLSLADGQKFMAAAFTAPFLQAEVNDAGTTTLSEAIENLLSTNPDVDANIVALILRDSEENREYLAKFCAKLVGANNSYWVTASQPHGGTKTMLLGFWFTQYEFIDEKTKLVMLGNFRPGQPILEIKLSDTTMLVSGVPSVESEYAARDFLREKLGLAEEDFEYEPNGTTTFPDWSMVWQGQQWNVEVTRVKEEVKKIVNMDKTDWPKQVNGVRRSRPRRQAYADKLQKKADRAANSSTPTLLVVFSELGNLSYQDVNLSAFAAVFEIDETSRDWRLIDCEP